MLLLCKRNCGLGLVVGLNGFPEKGERVVAL